MAGSTLPPKPFVHSLGGRYFLGAAEANPALGTRGRETWPLHLGGTLSLAGGEAGCCPVTVGRGQAPCAQRAPYTIDSAGSEVGTPASGVLQGVQEFS